MSSYKALVDYPASGTTYAVPFPYLAQSTVYAEVDGTDDPARTFDGSGNVVLSATPSAGSTVRILRRTPASFWGNFQRGAAIPNDERNNAAIGLQYYVEEVRDEAVLAAEQVGSLDPIASDEVQYISATGTDSYLLDYNVLPKQIKVFIGAAHQIGDQSLIAALPDAVTNGWALWYDTINELTYIKFAEDIPTGQDIVVYYRGGA